jgi:ribosomal protein S15P/S13E
LESSFMKAQSRLGKHLRLHSKAHADKRCLLSEIQDRAAILGQYFKVSCVPG